MSLERYEVTEHDGQKVLAVDPLEMADLMTVVDAAIKCMYWWISDEDHHGEFTELDRALTHWGHWDD